MQTAPRPRRSRPTPGARGRPPSRGAYLVGHFSEPHHTRLLQPRVPGVQRVHAVPEEPAGDKGLLTPPEPPAGPRRLAQGTREAPSGPRPTGARPSCGGRVHSQTPTPTAARGGPGSRVRGGEPPQCRWAASPPPQGLLGCSTPDREEGGSRWRLGPGPGRGQGAPTQTLARRGSATASSPRAGGLKHLLLCISQSFILCLSFPVYQEHSLFSGLTGQRF